LWHSETQLPTRTAQQKDHAQDAQKVQISHPPNPGAPRRAVPQARPQRSITYKGWPGRSSSARVERAHSDRARSASRRTTRLPCLFFSILLCSLRVSRACDTVRSLHLERGKRLWPQNRKKDLSFGIGGAGVAQTVLPPLRLPHRGSSPTSRLHPLIHTRTREFPSPFPLSSSLWAAPR